MCVLSATCKIPFPSQSNNWTIYLLSSVHQTTSSNCITSKQMHTGTLIDSITVAWLEETLTSWVQLKMWTDSSHWSRPSPDTTRTIGPYVTSSLIGRPICLDQWELSVHIVSCTQLVNVSSNHATVSDSMRDWKSVRLRVRKNEIVR